VASSYLSPGLVGVEDFRKGGRAVVALRPFPRDSLLVVWGGDIVTFAELQKRPLEERRLTLQVDDDAFMVSTTEGPADWINHSCDPNAGLRGQITLVAMRDIAAGEEVCFDYAMADSIAYDEFDCFCGASRCRGRVSASDWMRPELLTRYAGYLSPHLSRRQASGRASRRSVL